MVLSAFTPVRRSKALSGSVGVLTAKQVVTVNSVDNNFVFDVPKTFGLGLSGLTKSTINMYNAVPDKASSFFNLPRQKQTQQATSHYDKTAIGRPIQQHLATNNKALRGAVSELNLGVSLRAKRNNNKLRSTMLSDADIAQAEAMYKSRASRVIVCGCLANLYFRDGTHDEWQLLFTGIPVLLLNMGDSYVRQRRHLQLIITERRTGFALWKDNIDSLSDYKEVERTFHTLLHSENHRRTMGLSFDNAYAATEFHQRFKEFTDDPQNISLIDESTNPTATKRQRYRQRRNSFSSSKRQSTSMNKSQISMPCGFRHITSIKTNDVMSNSMSTASSQSSPSDGDTNNNVRRARSCVAIANQQVY